MPDLRPYQIEDIHKLLTYQCMGCFNQQRTGKSAVALKVMDARQINKFFVLCPSSGIYSWADEFEKWLGIRCTVIEGTPTKKKKLLTQWTTGLVISYDSFKHTKNHAGMIEEILAHHPEGVILDEAHRIKNRKSAAFKAAKACQKIKYRLALTGTPASGKQYEIFAILNWLYPTRFHGYWNFIEEFFYSYKRKAKDGHTFTEIGRFKPGKEKALQYILNEISTQRKRKDIMPWLPDKDYERIRLPATAEQTKYLEELRKYYETETVVTQGILDRLVRYRQICLDPALLNLKGKSPKTEFIKDYLTDYPEMSVIIFSKFTSYLERLYAELQHKFKCGLFVGATPLPHRKDLISNFQNGIIKVLLINIDAGKEALTLDRAETTIFTDKYPPIGDIQQAEDRFIATTEDKASKAHKIIELMIKDTYDEQIYKLLDKRSSEVDLINDYRKYLKGGTNGH